MSDREIMNAREGIGVSQFKLKQKYPDAKKHQIISFIKSGIRILGYGLIPFSLGWACGILILSEALGIIVEMV